MSRINTHRLRAAVGLVVAAGIGVAPVATDAGAVPGGAPAVGVVQAEAAAPQWSRPERLANGDQGFAAGVLDDGTSVAVEVRDVRWTDSSGAVHVGADLVEHRRRSGGQWAASRARRWSGVGGCSAPLGGAEGSTVAVVVRCTTVKSRVSFARALVWTDDAGWRGHRLRSESWRVDQAPNGNAVFYASRGRTTWLLVFNQARGQWNEIRKARPARTRDTRVAVDNGGNLLLADQVSGPDGLLLVVQRLTRGTWRPRRVLARIPQWLKVQQVDLNGWGAAVVAWVTRRQDREGNSLDVLKTATGVRGGRWTVEEHDRGWEKFIWARAGVDRADRVTLVWKSNPDQTNDVVMSRTRSATGAWDAVEQLSPGYLNDLDVNPDGTAAVAYCPTGSADDDVTRVRVRNVGEPTWGDEQSVGQAHSCPGSVSVGWDGTISLWWHLPESQPSVMSLWSSTADAVAPPPA